MITKPDHEPQEEEIEEISDAALYRHLIVNHVGLRDHYAAAALTALLNNNAGLEFIAGCEKKTGEPFDAILAEKAFQMADAMIAARDHK